MKYSGALSMIRGNIARAGVVLDGFLHTGDLLPYGALHSSTEALSVRM